MMKDAEIDSNDTDSENEDDTDSENEDEDTFVWWQKNKNRIKKMIEEFDESGNNYFKHCNKEYKHVHKNFSAQKAESLGLKKVTNKFVFVSDLS